MEERKPYILKKLDVTEGIKKIARNIASQVSILATEEVGKHDLDYKDFRALISEIYIEVFILTGKSLLEAHKEFACEIYDTGVRKWQKRAKRENQKRGRLAKLKRFFQTRRL